MKTVYAFLDASEIAKVKKYHSDHNLPRKDIVYALMAELKARALKMAKQESDGDGLSVHQVGDILFDEHGIGSDYSYRKTIAPLVPYAVASTYPHNGVGIL